MTKISRKNINVAVIPGPKSTVQPAVQEIKQPQRPVLANRLASSMRRFFLNDSSLAIIAEKSRIRNSQELEEVTTVKNHPQINDMALIVVSYGYDSSRYRAGTSALARLDRADPKPGKKIFIEVADKEHFGDLREREWDYRFFHLTDKMKGLFQKEALWNIGTELAFNDPNIQSVVLIDVDCAFHDNSWAYHISQSLAKFEFVQPYAAILYSDQHDAGMNNGVIPSIAYCVANHQSHLNAAPGGTYACNRNFYFNTLGGSWPINPVGSGDIGLWEYLYGQVPIVRNPTIKPTKNHGNFRTHPVGYAPLLLNHYYHGPMSNRMYRTRAYIADRCMDGTEYIINKDGILEWSSNATGKIMQKSMKELSEFTNAYLSVHRVFTTADTKGLFKKECKNELGAIDQNHLLKIVTVFKRNGAHTIDQINALKESIKKTFCCPYKFYVVSDAAYAFDQEDTIVCNMQTRNIPPGYEWVMASCIDASPNTSILYISPDVKMIDKCDMACCEDNTIYIPRIDGVWNTKLIYFKNMSFIRKAFYYDTNIDGWNIEDIYPESANYLIQKAISNYVKVKDILFHVDYDTTKKEQDKVTNFII